MNYFSLLFEQMLMEAIWDTNETFSELGIDGDPNNTESFITNLINYYELYYKYYELTTKPFSGHPKRKENIELQLKTRLISSMENIRNVLLPVFKNWLASHAITKPQEWARARLRDQVDDIGYDSIYDMSAGDIGEALDSLIWEWYRYVYPNRQVYQRPNESSIRSMFFQAVTKNIANMPNFQAAIGNNLIAIEKERRQMDLADMGEEEYKQQFGLGENDSAEEHAENVQLSDLDIGDMVSSYYDDMSSLAERIDADHLEPVIIELYEKMVFPVWYGTWKKQGIDQTRKNIEVAYKTLKNTPIDDVNKMAAAISIGLNAAHQTGQMIDYVSDYLEKNVDSGEYNEPTYDKGLKNLLDTLTNTPENIMTRWNNELEEIGVSV